MLKLWRISQGFSVTTTSHVFLQNLLNFSFTPCSTHLYSLKGEVHCFWGGAQPLTSMISLS